MKEEYGPRNAPVVSDSERFTPRAAANLAHPCDLTRVNFKEMALSPQGYVIAVPVEATDVPEQTVVVHAIENVNTNDSTSTSSRGIWSRLFGSSPRNAVTPPAPQLTRELPSQYSDCVGYDEKVAWINSERGLKILDQRPVLKEYHDNGRLLRMIQNRHWDVRLNEWLYISHQTEPQPIPLGLAFDTPAALKPEKTRNLEIVRDNPPIPVMFKDHPNFLEPRVFPTSAKYDILTDGYTVFRDVIPDDVVVNAVSAISKMVVESEEFSKSLEERRKDRSGDPFFTTGGTNDRDVLALYYCSPIYALVESLLHNEETVAGGKGAFHPRTGGAQVAFRFSQARPLMMGSRPQKIGGRSWHLDGMDKGLYGPFSLLIGVALSDQSQDNCGNLGVHPGSHHTLKSFLKQYSAACDHSGLDPADTRAIQERRLQAVNLVNHKPVLDEPVQVKLNKGDVVFALHKVAHLGTPNFSPNIRKMVYFRVSHKNLDKLRIPALDDIWIEYEGMSEVLY